MVFCLNGKWVCGVQITVLPAGCAIGDLVGKKSKYQQQFVQICFLLLRSLAQIYWYAQWIARNSIISEKRDHVDGSWLSSKYRLRRENWFNLVYFALIQNNYHCPMNVNAAHTSAKLTLWQELKEAVRGTEADYTKVSLKRAIFLLAVPMILELVMESAFSVVDIFFVGKLGSSAVATVGLTETYLFLLYAVAMGLSMAVTAIIARRVGEKNFDSAGISAVQAIIIGLAVSVLFAIAGIFYSKELLVLMGGDEWIVNEGYKYTQWMLGENLVIMMLL